MNEVDITPVEQRFTVFLNAKFKEPIRALKLLRVLINKPSLGRADLSMGRFVVQHTFLIRRYKVMNVLMHFPWGVLFIKTHKE